MSENLEKSKLGKLGIYDLRRLAREKGVKSPTTKKRDELIEEIKKLETGEQEPYFKKGGGRPPKPAIFSDIGGEDEVDISKENEDDGETAISEGVLEIMPQGYGFLRWECPQLFNRKESAGISKVDIYITAQNIKKAGLRAGDIVKCTFNPPCGGKAAKKIGLGGLQKRVKYGSL